MGRGRVRGSALRVWASAPTTSPASKPPARRSGCARSSAGTRRTSIVNTTAFSARGEDTGSPLDERGLPRHSGRAGGKLRRGVAQIRARAVLDRSCDARRAAGNRRADFCGRDLVQGPRSLRRCVSPSARARHRTRCRPRRGVGAFAAEGAARSGSWRLMLSTYPGRPDQIAHAVGLDGPASALKIARHLQGEGYSIEGFLRAAAELVEPFVSSQSALPLTPVPSPARGEGNVSLNGAQTPSPCGRGGCEAAG